MFGVFERLLAPGLAFTGRLAMVWKIAAVCTVLLVPTLLLGNGYRSGMATQTSFAAKERAGIEYARPLMNLVAATVELRTANVNGSNGDAARSAIDKNVQL